MSTIMGLHYRPVLCQQDWQNHAHQNRAESPDADEADDAHKDRFTPKWKAGRGDVNWDDLTLGATVLGVGAEATPDLTDKSAA